jgi:hypothetical protein
MITLESLSKNEPLLLMLESRSLTHPCKFAMTDLDGGLLLLGPLYDEMKRRALKIGPTCVEYAMVVCDEEHYGRVYELATDSNGPDLVKLRRHLSLLEGCVMVDVQRQLYSFIARVAEDIVRDQLDDPSASKADITSLPDLMFQAPYRLPGSMDISRIHALVDAQLRQLQDKLLALRDNPGYFSDEMETAKQHRLELILDDKDQIHPSQKPPLSLDKTEHREFWAEVTKDVVIVPMTEILSLTMNLERARNLWEIHSMNPNPDQNKALPETYARAFNALYFSLVATFAGCRARTASLIRRSPEMRRYSRRIQVDGKELLMTVFSHVQDAPGTQEFAVAADVLDQTEHDLLPDISLLSALVYRLEDVYRKYPDIVSARVASEISNLSLFLECIRQMDLFRPWSITAKARLSSPEVRHTYFADQKYKDFSKLWEYKVPLSVADLAIPEPGRFDFPVDKILNDTHDDQMKSAYKALTEFWTALTLELERENLKFSSSMDVFRRPQNGWWQPVTKAVSRADIRQVDKRALKVFNTLFYMTPENEPPQKTS